MPPDEVAKYESKGKQWADSIPKLPPGVHEEEAPLTKNQKKRKNKKKEVSDNQRCEVSDVTEKLRTANVSNAVSSTAAGTIYTSNPDDLKVKRVKNLRKKLRQIEELQAKIDSGELVNPEATQLDKLSRRKEIEKELEELEAEV